MNSTTKEEIFPPRILAIHLMSILKGMQRWILITVLIGISCPILSHSEDIPSIDEKPKPGMVVVEPTNLTKVQDDGSYNLVPYGERRGKWGVLFGLEYSTYEPYDYEPNFIALDYKDVYGAPEVPFLEVQFGVKRNFSIASLGLEAGVGVFKAESKENLVDLTNSTLVLYPIRMGFTLALDNLFSDEPWVVPYVNGGAYTIFFRESQASASFNGNTQVAPYAIGGLAITLDWLDRRSAREAYESSGIEASHLFVEARKYFGNDVEKDPDFETDPVWGAGIHVEF